MINSPFSKTILTISLIALFFCQNLLPHETAFFYKNSPLWKEPRFEKDFLFSADVSFSESSASKSRDRSHNKQNLLDIYGKQNMHLLGKNVPCKDLDKPTDCTLALLSRIPAKNCFGQLSFSGEFDCTQVDISLIQNFKRGFFASFYIPIKKLEISCIKFQDLSPSCPAIPNKDNPLWQSFLTQFDTIMAQYCVDIGAFRKTAAGDIYAMLGWTRNYEETEIFDFVDTSIQAGVLIPSGRKKDPDKAFGLAHGYDGHIGIPVVGDIAIGLYEWLTLGGHIDALILFNRTKDLHMKTAREQSGFIKLAKGRARVKPGLLINGGAYVKADHFVGGLSCAIGYSFAFKNDNNITPCDKEKFDIFIVNSDEMAKKWKSHTLHFATEYDFTQEDSKFGARVGFFYDWNIGGQRTFKTNTIGITFGLDITMN